MSTRKNVFAGYINSGYNHMRHGDFERAKCQFEFAESASSNKVELAEATSMRGVCELRLGHTKTALEVLGKALESAKASGDLRLVSVIQRHLGEARHDMGVRFGKNDASTKAVFSRAHEALDESLRILADEAPSAIETAATDSVIGMLVFDQGYAKAGLNLIRHSYGVLMEQPSRSNYIVEAHIRLMRTSSFINRWKLFPSGLWMTGKNSFVPGARWEVCAAVLGNTHYLRARARRQAK